MLHMCTTTADNKILMYQCAPKHVKLPAGKAPSYAPQASQTYQPAAVFMQLRALASTSSERTWVSASVTVSACCLGTSANLKWQSPGLNSTGSEGKYGGTWSAQATPNTQNKRKATQLHALLHCSTTRTTYAFKEQ
jgi:hypothetical protein